MKFLIKLIMLGVSVFWLLCLFIVPMYRIQVDNGWMMLNPSGEFPAMQLILFLTGSQPPLIDMSGMAMASAITAITLLVVNGFWILNRAIAFLHSPISRFSFSHYLMIAIMHIAQTLSILWLFSSLNRGGIQTNLTRDGWIACIISLALIFVMYPLKRKKVSQPKGNEQAQHDLET